MKHENRYVAITTAVPIFQAVKDMETLSAEYYPLFRVGHLHCYEALNLIRLLKA